VGDRDLWVLVDEFSVSIVTTAMFRSVIKSESPIGLGIDSGID
jgi:hypothetical protein